MDCLQLFVTNSRKGSVRRRSGECGGKGTGGGNSLVSEISLWYWALVGETLDCLGNSFGTGFGGVYNVATIAFSGASDIQAIKGGRGPSSTLGVGLED